MKSKLHDQSGLSLVEVVIAVGLFAVTLTMILQMISQALTEVTRGRNLMTRDRVINNLVNYASLPAAIRASVSSLQEPFNEKLKDCAFGTRVNECENKNGTAGYLGFRLYLPTVENTSTPDSSGVYGTLTSGAITGVPAYPMRYSQFGDMCDTYTSNCSPEDWPIEAFTEFLPYTAENIHIAWRKIGGRTWNGPVYPEDPTLPNALDRVPHTFGSEWVKVRLTVRPSSGSGIISKMTFPPFISTVFVDMRLVNNGRQ